MTHVCLLLGGLLLAEPAAAPRQPAPLYTNEDLERVHPYRGQTGVLCIPAVTPMPNPPRGAQRKAGHSEPDAVAQESYWRRTASQHRQRLARLQSSADALRARIEGLRRERPSSRAKGSTSKDQLAARLRAIESEIARIEAEFEERARQAGALPGWLR